MPSIKKGNDTARKKRALLLLLLFAFCAEARAQPTNMDPAKTVAGVRMVAHPDTTSIHVTWYMQDASIDVDEYKLSLRGEEFILEMAYISGTKTTFFDLVPCVDYEISVQPFDKLGKSLENPSVQSVTTRASELPAVPRLSARNITARSLSLSWERPPTACEITYYNITYSGVAKWGPRTEHTGSATIGRANGNTGYAIDSLQPYTDYTVTVTAFTEAGKGKTAVMNSTTQQDVPSEPTNLKALDISTKSIIMVWKEPQEQKGVVDSYKVTWNSSGLKPHSEIANHPVHIIARLTPCTNYTVQVAGITKGGTGQHSKIEVTTETEAPLQPLDTTCHLNSDQTVSVTWAKPETACPITGFKVSRPGNSLEPNAMAEIDVPSTVFSDNFSTVPGRNFSVCVAAVASDTIMGPQACCESPKSSATFSAPAPPVLPTTKSTAAINSEMDQAQKKSNSTVMAIGVGVGVCVPLLITIATIVFVCKRRTQTPGPALENNSAETQVCVTQTPGPEHREESEIALENIPAETQMDHSKPTMTQSTPQLYPLLPD